MKPESTLLFSLALSAMACGGEPDSTRRESGTPPDSRLSPTPELVGPGVISTARNQTFPAEDPVDGSLWFSEYEDSFDEQTIRFARRTDRGWAVPETAPFSGRWGDRAPRFSPDGNTLYFTSNRPRARGGTSGDMNIWQVSRKGDSWGEPELVPTGLNSTARDIHSSATAGGIWVASNRDGGFGRSDVYRTDLDGTTVHLGAPINDEYSQPDLWVSTDETWMVLVITEHPSGYGGDDLYLSRFDGASWSPPINLGPTINTAEYEYGPTVSADGTHLFFTSHRGGRGDVYRIPVASFLDQVE